MKKPKLKYKIGYDAVDKRNAVGYYVDRVTNKKIKTFQDFINFINKRKYHFCCSQEELKQRYE